MGTVLIVGAGATKACGGPTTEEILPQAFAGADELERAGFLRHLEEFLIDHFRLPPDRERRSASDYPPLPLVLSLVDTAINRGHPFGDRLPHDLVRIRDALEYAIFAVLELRLQRIRNHYGELYARVFPEDEPTVVSLNYDIIADNALIAFGRDRNGEARLPEYGCDIDTDFYRDSVRFGRLFKLHGSLNWTYCPKCSRLDLGIARSSVLRTEELLADFFQEYALEDRYARAASACPEPGCGGLVRPVMITPTHAKDYRNPHVSRIWFEAERAMRRSDRAIFVGYSMPEDDIEVLYLFKRALMHLDPERITVVEHDPEDRTLVDHPVGRRYRGLFGPGLEWRTDGLTGWLGAAG